MNIRLSNTKAIVHRLGRVLNVFGLGILCLMMMLTVADVLFRYTLNEPILGTIELTEYMMLIIFYFGFSWCHINKRNVRIDFFVKHLPQRVQVFFDCIAVLLGLGIFSLVAWQGFIGAGEVWEFYKTSDVLKIPAYPFHLVLAFGSCTLCLVLLLDLIGSIGEAIKR
jgi:TRAP-type C4-dicarboxylate transport system permease small subunit